MGNKLVTMDVFSLTSTNSMASYHRISKLTMAGNLLDNLDTTNLPKSLEHLDLRNNLLTEIDTAGLPIHLKHLALAGNQVQQLSDENLAHFSKEGLTVNLEGNPFLCSCSSLNLHSFLLEHYPSVDKFKNITITCNVEEEMVEKYLYELKEVEFCEPLPVLLISLVFGFFLLLVFFVLFLQLFYGDIIVIWVFSRPWGKVFFSSSSFSSSNSSTETSSLSGSSRDPGAKSSSRKISSTERNLLMLSSPMLIRILNLWRESFFQS